MNLEMQVNKANAGLWTVTYGRKKAPLEVQEAAFAANRLEIISPAQLAFLRVNEKNGIFLPYSKTNADVFYDDRTDRVVIVPNREISKRVGTPNLVDAHRQGRESIIPENQRVLIYGMVDEMLRNGIAFVVPHGHIAVQTSEFGENDLTSRLFSDEILGIKAQEYGDWLRSKGVNVNTFFMDGKNYSQAQRAPYSNRLRVYGHGLGLGADGLSMYLHSNNGAFGVNFKKTAEGGAK
jgi:hypothetical protein